MVLFRLSMQGAFIKRMLVSSFTMAVTKGLRLRMFEKMIDILIAILATSIFALIGMVILYVVGVVVYETFFRNGDD